jgi:hypothetical protein
MQVSQHESSRSLQEIKTLTDALTRSEAVINTEGIKMIAVLKERDRLR